MVVDIGNPQNCYECLIRNRGYSGDGMKCGKTGSVISWYDGNRQRMVDCPLFSSNPSMDAAIEKVISERIRQIQLWGECSNNHPFEWMSILGEEFGELCEAVNETCFKNGVHPELGGQDKIIEEATQVAAVAISIIEQIIKQQERIKDND